MAARAPGPGRCRSRWRRAALRPAARPAAPARAGDPLRSAVSADRLDRRGAVAAREQPADRMHDGASGGVRGAKVKSDASRRRARRGRPATRATSRRAVVDQRVHRDDVVEAAERRVEHVADAEVDAAGARDRAACARGRGRPASARGRSRRHRAPRRAASTASAPVPQPASSTRAAAQVGGQPVEQGAAHPVAAGPHGGADAADGRIGGQPRPGLDRGAVEIGLELRRGARW